MKNTYSFLALCFFIIVLASCSKDDNINQSNSSFNTPLEIRNIDNWCDEGNTSPPPFLILDNYINAMGQCCVILSINPTFNGLRVRYGTTNYNWNTMSGIPVGVFDYANIIDNVTEFCFDQIGSHVIVEIYDENGVVACGVIPNLC